MKKQISLLVVLIATNFFIFSSCDKDDDNPPPQQTKTQLLTTGSWRFSSATANGADASGYLQACQKDNIYIFLVAGTGTIDEGPTKCNAGDPQTAALTWNWMSGETILHINTTLFSNTSNDFTLVSISATQLVVTTLYTPPIGPSIVVQITFVH